MTTMNTNHMFDCDQLLQIGESLLEDPSILCWGDDIGKELEMADLTSANVNIWEPAKNISSCLMPETQLPQMENDLDLSLLDLDLTSLLSHSSVPSSPYSEDSGVWSPGSANSPGSPQDSLGNLCDSDDTVANLAPSTYEYHNLLSHSTTLDFPLELPISVTDTTELHSLGPFATASSDTGPVLEGENLQITTIDILPSPSTPKSPKPIAPRKSRSSVKTKSLTPQEKRERKKEQNKNAATRYREKKRAEGESVMKIQTGMEEKNKELKDKVSQVTREIQYLKELLIEVYRTKGIIE